MRRVDSSYAYLQHLPACQQLQQPINIRVPARMTTRILGVFRIKAQTLFRHLWGDTSPLAGKIGKTRADLAKPGLFPITPISWPASFISPSRSI